jgi:hypothetical protein
MVDSRRPFQERKEVRFIGNLSAIYWQYIGNLKEILRETGGLKSPAFLFYRPTGLTQSRFGDTPGS